MHAKGVEMKTAFSGTANNNKRTSSVQEVSTNTPHS